MRIAFYSPYLPKHTGGGEKYLFDCAKILREEGHQVQVACSARQDLSGAEINAIKQKYEQFLNYSLEGIEFVATPLFTNASFLTKLLWTAKFDVLYYQTDGSLFFSLARHNILHIQVPLKLHKSSVVEKLKLANWRVKNTNSEFTKKHIEQFWQTKVNFVHQPFVDHKEFIAQQSWQTSKTKTILSVGRFFCQLHSKRQDVLVKFFKDLVILDPQALADWKLVLVGKKEDEAFASKVARLASGLNIEIIHDLDRQELIKRYQQASLYWHTSGFQIDENEEPEKVEHFGISTLEAMSARAVPIVISKGGQKEILGTQLTNCLWNNEADCLAKTLEMIKNENKRVEIAELAYQRSLFFSKERFRQILLAMLANK